MVGKYRHTVDPKGRLFVPSKLKDELGDSFYVTLGLDHCLSVYTEEGWQAITDKYNALPISQARKMRFLFANAAKCEPDKQGRFLIPTTLRDYAGLTQEVIFIGQAGHAEIWDTQTGEIRPAETEYSGTQKFFLLRRNSRTFPMTKTRLLHSENSSQRALPPIQCAGPLSPALQGKSLLNFSGHVTGRMSDLTMQRNCWD